MKRRFARPAVMVLNTKTLFMALLKRLRADCVCDIGSRDGDQALSFRQVCPAAVVMAFEANPINYKTMVANEKLRGQRIDLYPYAVSDARGTAQFHVTDVDYQDPTANIGTSSLLVSAELKIKETVEVETRRLDELIPAQYPQSKMIGLWIDVEGAEYRVLEGIAGIHDRVVAVHVETCKVPMRAGQKTLPELERLMSSYGLMRCGTNMRKTSDWGDVVFVSQNAIRSLGAGFTWCKLKGYASAVVPVDRIAVFLKARFPAAYRLLRRIYLKAGT